MSGTSRLAKWPSDEAVAADCYERDRKRRSGPGNEGESHVSGHLEGQICGRKKSRRSVQLKLRPISEFGRRIEALEGRARCQAARASTAPRGSTVALLRSCHAPGRVHASGGPGRHGRPGGSRGARPDDVPTSDFSDAISLNSTDGTAHGQHVAGAGGSADPVRLHVPIVERRTSTFLHYLRRQYPGPTTLTASDTTDTRIADDTATTNVVAPGRGHPLCCHRQTECSGRLPASVLVEALDANNHVVPNYEGTITLSSSDTAATVRPTTET